MLKLKNISKNYTSSDIEVKALKNINLNFRKNEFVSILGQSGCGKTTLLNIIGGLDKYTSGDLIIQGKSTKDYDDRDWDSYRNHSIGFIFQSYNLINHLSIIKNVEMALIIGGLSKHERKQKAIQALEAVGLKDHIHKKPNQLSGGQMQRVAIARAIVNNPQIILADEPTGALDSKTSIQVMEILKKLSEDKLIIMVTHNAELAEEYSSRIISIKDGQIQNDTMPFNEEDKEKESVEFEEKQTKKKKTSMNMITALNLSLQNLLTKKARTILTSIAGSIGIIGVALILALSTGFQAYIDKTQADTMSSYPITITETSYDLTSMISTNSNNNKTNILNKIYVNKALEQMKSLQHDNNITDEYITNVINTIDASLYNDIVIMPTTNLQIYKEISPNIYRNVTQNNSLSIGDYSQQMNLFTPLLNNKKFILSQYDLIGDYPKENADQTKQEVVLVLNQESEITDLELMLLGMSNGLSTPDTIEYDEVIGQSFYLSTNNTYYQKLMEGENISKFINGSENVNDVTGYIELKIVGILRQNQETSMGCLDGKICFLPSLVNYFMAEQANSDIVIWQKANPTKDCLSGTYFVPTSSNSVESQYNQRLKEINGNTSVTSISIYPTDFSTKDEIKKHLDTYNVGKDEADKIIYTDAMEVFMSAVNTIIVAISSVLIAFTAISLVVSSIMIGIITYVSVLERTKEIGILRAIGARKKDISRVFNAETLIVGFTAGAIGVIFTYLISIPINIILANVLEITNICSLPIISGLILIAISMFLTFISGLIPAKIAAKKDPVVALRTE